LAAEISNSRHQPNPEGNNRRSKSLISAVLPLTISRCNFQLTRRQVDTSQHTSKNPKVILSATNPSQPKPIRIRYTTLYKELHPTDSSPLHLIHKEPFARQLFKRCALLRCHLPNNQIVKHQFAQQLVKVKPGGRGPKPARRSAH
jgi:hypothetical protein